MKQRSLETTLLIAALRKCYDEGKMATYADLEKIVNRCATVNRGNLTSAIHAVKVEYGYLFKCIPTIGYKPIPNVSKVAEIERVRLQKIRSQVNMFEGELNCVNVTELPKSEREKYFTAQVKLSAHQMILHEKLDNTYAIAGNRCANTGTIDFDLGDIQDAFKALKMA